MNALLSSQPGQQFETHETAAPESLLTWWPMLGIFFADHGSSVSEFDGVTHDAVAVSTFLKSKGGAVFAADSSNSAGTFVSLLRLYIVVRFVALPHSTLPS